MNTCRRVLIHLMNKVKNKIKSDILIKSNVLCLNLVMSDFSMLGPKPKKGHDLKPGLKRLKNVSLQKIKHT